MRPTGRVRCIRTNETKEIIMDADNIIEATFERRAKNVLALAELLRKAVYGLGGSWRHGEKRGVILNHRYEVHPIEEDGNVAPGGTTDFSGRAISFVIYEGEGRARREYYVTVEDVTLDDVILGEE